MQTNDPELDEDGNVTLYQPTQAEVAYQSFSEHLVEINEKVGKWQVNAACWKKPKGYMYPPRDKDQARVVNELCLNCGHQVDCLYFALLRKEEFGVWGGTTEKDRAKILRAVVSVVPDFQATWSEEIKNIIYKYADTLVKIHKAQNGKNIFEAQA